MALLPAPKGHCCEFPRPEKPEGLRLHVSEMDCELRKIIKDEEEKISGNLT